MTRTHIHLLIGTREWHMVQAGNLTREQVQTAIQPILDAHLHDQGLFLEVTRAPWVVGKLTPVADWWLGWHTAVRLGLYSAGGLLAIVAAWLCG